jgi:cyanophycinase
VARLIRRRNAAGVPVAGTSAGASFLSEHMIARGQEGSTPRSGMVALAPGLGLTNRFVIDQHFRQRDRLGRLLTALAYNPFAIGLGLDEDTAGFYGPDNRLEVVGSGAITVVDPSQLDHSSMDVARRGGPVSLIGIRLHILINGDLLDAHTREARPGRDRQGQ